MAEIYWEDTPVRVIVGGEPQTLDDVYLVERIIAEVGEENLVAGPRGEDGAAGRDGVDGRTIHPTDGRPSDEVGEDGDLAFDPATSTVYGPKDSGAWPAGVSLVGPRGETGDRGEQGERGETGATGERGAQGDPGPGLPRGGETGQLAAKASSSDHDVEWIAAPAVDADAGVSSLRRLGAGAREAAPGATALHVVHAGDDADTARPAGAAVVLWIVDEGITPRALAAGDLVAEQETP